MNTNDIIMDEEELNNETIVLNSWTKEEKFYLYQALIQYGSEDIEQISNLMPTKSDKEIEAALSYYRKKASLIPVIQPKKAPKKKVESNSSIPLANWAKLLLESKTYEELNTDIAFALRLIADFEEKPFSREINIRTIYYTLANALEGKSVKMDKITKSVIEQCMLDSSVASNTFVKPFQLRTILENIRIDENVSNSLRKISECHDEANIQYLISQKAYNPFNFSQNILKNS
ncbi:uncharacterized protein LOC126969830 [Leptidea sinapis]|uniref:uncharacterized protein LOC126969830 n=1 Tax=Leptidea sinapis TaxID=189913 RepID=UPI002121BD8F|nr:uncharacterized protein LOC126969830 [Leptidea sinapis]